MINNHSSTILPKFFLILTLLFCIVVNASFADGEIDVITNRNVPENTLSQYDLYQIFTRKYKTWDNGEPITLVMLDPKNETHRKFLTNVIGISTVHFNNMMYGKKGRYLRIVDSQENAIYKISDIPWAVGYVDGITYISNHEEVKHIQILR